MDDSAALRILMFSDSYGGVTSTFIRNEVEYFSTRHRLKYLTLTNLVPEAAYDIEVVSWPYRPVWDRIEWRLWLADRRCSFRDSRFSRSLRAAIARFRPDVIHCQFGYEALRLLQNIDVFTSVPILVHFHGYDASEMLRKTSYVREIRNFLKVPHVWPIVVSQFMQGEMEAAGLDVQRARVLHCGIDLDLFVPKPTRQDGNRDEEDIVMVQVSSLIIKKGHRETLQALALMLARNASLRSRVRFQIAGDGPERNRLQDLVVELGLSGNVHFLGTMTPTQAVELLSNADVFVHHSIEESTGHKEGIPTAIMEAMAMELPVLSTLHAGIPELVEHGVHGLLCRERDIETYSRQMEEVLTWGRRPQNRQRIRDAFNKTTHNATLERIYRDVIACRR